MPSCMRSMSTAMPVASLYLIAVDAGIGPPVKRIAVGYPTDGIHTSRYASMVTVASTGSAGVRKSVVGRSSPDTRRKVPEPSLLSSGPVTFHTRPS